jgi:hypothetical protein
MFTVARRTQTTCMTTFAVISLAACTVSSRGSMVAVTPRDPLVISATDVDAIRGRVDNAFDVVRLLRPSMLVARGSRPSPGSRLSVMPNDQHQIHVYLDRVAVGGIEMLQRVPKEAIVRVEWLSSIDATIRYGAGHMAGVIDVTTGVRR